MSMKKVTLDEAIASIPTKKTSLFYLLNGETKNIRFIGDFNSFIPLRMHTIEINTSGYVKYDTRFCLENNCTHCSNDNESKICMYLPIYECDFTGHIGKQDEKIWKLPYLAVYNHFKELPEDIKKLVNKKFVFHITRDNNKYDVKFSYISSIYDNLKIVEYLPNHFLNIIIDMYGKGDVKKIDDNVMTRSLSSSSIISNKSHGSQNNNFMSPIPENKQTHSQPVYDQQQQQFSFSTRK